MPIYKGETLIVGVHKGEDRVERVYHGEDLVYLYDAGADPYVPGPRKFWRVTFYRATGSNAQYQEYYFYDASDVLLSTGGTPAASASNGSFPISMGFDGIINNDSNRHVFAGNADGGWITYEFATPVVVSKIAMRSTQFLQYYRAFTVENSSDGVTWVLVHGQPIFTIGSTVTTQSATLDSNERLKAWRLLGTAVTTGTAQLAELKAFDAGDVEIPILAVSCPEGASSGNSAWNLLDGSNATKWASSTAGAGSSLIVYLPHDAPPPVKFTGISVSNPAGSYNQHWSAVELYDVAWDGTNTLVDSLSGVAAATAAGQTITYDFDP